MLMKHFHSWLLNLATPLVSLYWEIDGAAESVAPTVNKRFVVLPLASARRLVLALLLMFASLIAFGSFVEMKGDIVGWPTTTRLGKRNCSNVEGLQVILSSCFLAHISSTKWWLVLACLLMTADAQLTAPEQAALGQLFNSYPDLVSIPAWEQLTDEGTYYGRSWTNNFQTICTSGDGYDLYGVFCQNGHIAGLRITTYWGRPTNVVFNQVSGLTFIKNLTVSSEFPSASFIFHQALTQAIASTSRLVHIEVPTLETLTLLDPSVLLSLRTDNYPFFSLSDYSSLREVTVSLENYATFNWASHPTLESVHFIGDFDLAQIPGSLASFPSLKSFICERCIYSQNTSIELSGNLIHFELICGPVARIVDDMIITSSTLETLSVCSTNVSLNTPNLKSLKAGFLSGGISMPQLTSWSLVIPFYYLPTWSEYLCPILANSVSGLTVFELEFTNFVQPFSVPSCFRNYDSLIDVSLKRPILDGSFLQNIPVKVQSIVLQDFDLDVTPGDFLRFPYLKSLYISAFGSHPMTGSIPEEFFIKLPRLESLTIASPIVGTIPWYGWSNLVNLDILGDIEAFPGLDSAPRLKTLKLSSSSMSIIPNDTYFEDAGLTSLETFYLNNGQAPVAFPYPDGPIPGFWISSPRIAYVFLKGNFSGPHPSPLSAPRLRSLEYDSPGGICGFLPDIAIPLHLNSFDLSSQLNGSIPNSWGPNLTIYESLNLANNLLEGSIPPQILSHHALRLKTVTLNNNAFTGALWNMSQGTPTVQLSVQNTWLDVCLLTPPSNYNISRCGFGSLPTCPVGGCATDWSAICDTIAPVCSPNTVVAPAVLPCEMAVRISLPLSSRVVACPPPAPDGFVCYNGVWVFPNDLVVATFSFPPNLGTIVIQGNFSASGQISFSGTGTTLEISGCIDNLSEVLIEVNPNEKTPTTTLIKQNGGNQCTTDLSQIPVLVKPTKNSCKKVESSNSDATPASLTIAFTIDHRRCNTKWIILGSVLGFVVLAVVVGILIFVSCRTVENPFKKSKEANSEEKK